MHSTYKSILGYRVIEDLRMVQDGPLITVNRTWLERLFSWPWTPKIRSKKVPSKIPLKEIRKTGNCLIMHPVVAKRLRIYIKLHKYSLVRIYFLQHLKEPKCK